MIGKNNEKYRKTGLEKHSWKSKIAAGLACGTLLTICKGINKGNTILLPDGNGNYMVGEVQSLYYYVQADSGH